jgi:hypothetical protein
MAPNRVLERLAWLEIAAGQRPAAGEGLERPLPEEHLEHAVSHLQDDGEGDVGRSGPARLADRFLLHSRKL